MMIVDVDGGRLRLGGHHVEALLRGLGSPFAPAEPDAGTSAALDAAWAELVDAGVVTASGRPAEAFAGSFAPLAAPWLAVQALAMGPSGENAHQVWVDPAGGVAAAHVRDGWYDLIPVSPTGVPAAVVRLCSLGPWPRVEPGEVAVAAELVEALGSGEGTGAAGLLDRLVAWPGVAEAVRAGDWRIVRVSADWAPGLFAGAAQADAASRSLMLLDTPGGGLILVPRAAEVVLQAASATDVWQLLVSITRPPAELAPQG